MGIARVTYADGKTYARTYGSEGQAQVQELGIRGAVSFVWIPRTAKSYQQGMGGAH